MAAPARPRRCFTLPADLLEALERVSLETDVPQSRLVERALRAALPTSPAENAGAAVG